MDDPANTLVSLWVDCLKYPPSCILNVSTFQYVLCLDGSLLCPVFSGWLSFMQLADCFLINCYFSLFPLWHCLISLNGGFLFPFETRARPFFYVLFPSLFLSSFPLHLITILFEAHRCCSCRNDCRCRSCLTVHSQTVDTALFLSVPCIFSFLQPGSCCWPPLSMLIVSLLLMLSVPVVLLHHFCCVDIPHPFQSDRTMMCSRFFYSLPRFG